MSLQVVFSALLLICLHELNCSKLAIDSDYLLSFLPFFHSVNIVLLTHYIINMDFILYFMAVLSFCSSH